MEGFRRTMEAPRVVTGFCDNILSRTFLNKKIIYTFTFDLDRWFNIINFFNNIYFTPAISLRFYLVL